MTQRKNHMDHIVSEKSGAAIQGAINEAAARGGGRVVLEPGVYTSGTICLRSNIELHIPAGAKIQGADTPEAYDDFPHPCGVYPENGKKVLLACADAENVSVTGKGEINGAGPAFYDTNVPPGHFFLKPPHPRPRMVQFHNCRNVLFEGVSFVDSPGWTFFISECEDVNISRIRVDGCQQMINNDGIDIDSCKRVAISDSFFRTGDDCIILRAIRKGDKNTSAVCEGVVVTNCVLDSWCQGIRIGCTSDDTIRNARFDNIVFKGRGTGILFEYPMRYVRKNCEGYINVSDISFNHISIDAGRHPIRISCDPEIKSRRIAGITFSNIRLRGTLPLHFCGTPPLPLEDITLRDIAGEIESDTPLVARYVLRHRMENVSLTATTGEPVPFVRQESPSWETHF